MAKWKTQIRKCNQTIFVNDWIESIPRLGIGSFSFVACTGVLHHLKNPTTGLNILKFSQLEVGRGILMVYGTYGRTGVYHLQDLFKLIEGGTQNMKERIDSEIKNAKLVMKKLPKDHWFYHLRITDYEEMGDSGLYDLLLHKRDVSFSIKTLDEWLTRSNFNLIDFTLAWTRHQMSLETIVEDNILYSALSQIHILDQQFIVELIKGFFLQHSFFTSTYDKSEASLDTPNNGIFLYGLPTGFRATFADSNNIHTLRNKTYLKAKIVNMLQGDNPMTKKVKNLNSETSILWPLTDFTTDVLFALTKHHSQPKGSIELTKNFLKEKKSNVSLSDLRTSLVDLFSYLKKSGLFFIKSKKIIGCFPKTCNHVQFLITGSNYENRIKGINEQI